MREFIISMAIVASGALSAPMAFGQSDEAPPTVPEAEKPAEQELPPPLPFDVETTREMHLDQLFALLATPDLRNWEQVAGQIQAAWNRSGSDSMDLLSRRADKAMAADDYDTALLHLNDLVRLAPDYAEGWNKRATVYFLQGEYGPSLEDIAETLRREPRHFGALSGLGIILDRIGDKKGALEAYRRAAAIHPHLPGAQEGIKKLAKEVEGQRL